MVYVSVVPPALPTAQWPQGVNQCLTQLCWELHMGYRHLHALAGSCPYLVCQNCTNFLPGSSSQLCMRMLCFLFTLYNSHLCWDQRQSWVEGWVRTECCRCDNMLAVDAVLTMSFHWFTHFKEDLTGVIATFYSPGVKGIKAFKAHLRQVLLGNLTTWGL